MINGEETQAQFKERILSVVKTIIENGLTMRDGDFATAFREKFLNTLGAWIKTMHENGLDQNIKPRRWDSCNGFGSEPVACHDPYRDVFPQKRRDREARQGGLHLGLGNK